MFITVVSDDAAMDKIFAVKGPSLLKGAAGKLFINCATISPGVHIEVEKRAKAAGASSLEACMASSITQARDGTLYLMIGGEDVAVKHLAPAFTTLAPEHGWAHVGAVGAGHYVKMVHNGIEYSMMQGYAEGFELMSKSGYHLDLARIADLWMHGSVVRSWLLELAAGALKEDQKLEHLKGYVQDSGEGRWMIADAIDKDVPVPTLTAALFTRFRSRQAESFAEKMLAALRNAFGGHAVRR